MALTRRERFGFEGPGELVRRLLEGDWEGNGLLKVEEFRDGDDLVVRSELPGIDPGKDVGADGVERHAPHSSRTPGEV